jgi:NADH-quinone oxidoreductase subunit K
MNLEIPTLLLWLSAFLFSVGLLTVSVRRNVIIMLIGIELMLNASNLAFVVFARQWAQINGQTQVFFIITIAAAESAVGLSILINIFRNFNSVKTDATVLLNDRSA